MRFRSCMITSAVLVVAAAVVMPASSFAAEEPSAILPIAQVNEDGFGDTGNTDAHLLKLYKPGQGGWKLYAATTNEDGIQLWKSNKRGTEWEELSGSSLDLDSGDTNVFAVRAFRGRPYVAFGDDDSSEIWRYLWKSGWEKVADVDGQVTFLRNVNRKRLYYGVTHDGSDATLHYFNGSSVQQLSDDGLGQDVEQINDLMRYKNRLYVATEGKGILRKDKGGDDWNEVYNEDGQAIETFRRCGSGSTRKLVAGGEDETNGALVLKTKKGASWDVVVEGFEDSEGTRVNSMGVTAGGTLRARVINTTTGPEIWETEASSNLSDWNLFRTDGLLDNSNNSRLTSSVWYRGHMYGALKNTTDGTQVYKVLRRPTKVEVTSHTWNQEVSGDEITFSGTSETNGVYMKVILRSQGQELGSALSDADGNWSITITDQEAGARKYRFYNRFANADGVAAGRLNSKVLQLIVTE